MKESYGQSLVNWHHSILLVAGPVSQGCVPLLAEENPTLCGLETGIYFSFITILWKSRLVLLSFSWCSPYAGCRTSNMSPLVLENLFSVKAGERVLQGRVPTTHILLIRKTKAFPKSCGLLHTSHWLELCDVEQQKCLALRLLSDWISVPLG